MYFFVISKSKLIKILNTFENETFSQIFYHGEFCKKKFFSFLLSATRRYHFHFP